MENHHKGLKMRTTEALSDMFIIEPPVAKRCIYERHRNPLDTLHPQQAIPLLFYKKE